MTWVYNVRKRSFEQNGVYKFSADYAGAPGYKNEPDFECVVNKGPLPRGKYKIVGKPFRHHHAGPYTLRLQPYSTNNMCGRNGFLIHGGNSKGTASNGCIILHPTFRRVLYESGDKELIVL
ncbi:DUF2778 domain-containing protein [Chimaeribacter arupi]|uniref:DUF2778 domain-containing protein n=2 Tax=Yersiniaceae TaxID=1903411 RepID=A0A2N5EJK6_9GAMM|nr:MULTISPECIES: tlde1 domain-containing protein [Yersiniaceae]MBS0969067.1 DUF2778 domain-containing protein [Nissabacter archeti]MDV5141670.1 DUF2778 domain-containing protein [Chimaeribacter arupi]PLR42943.1 DUF2778 domain-containing protein [Chimaeribacter arupi]PLR45929.1 DUF2778 domain-containing protein [Chimaeribacter arupi]PLR52006.1 DUF2778 domain-containing protein [Chimaeribacter arupi]